MMDFKPSIPAGSATLEFATGGAVENRQAMGWSGEIYRTTQSALADAYSEFHLSLAGKGDQPVSLSCFMARVLYQFYKPVQPCAKIHNIRPLD